MIIQQLLHGYKRGHQLLSGSVQLDTQSLELATRLSDLSGSMTFDTDIHPYLTCYPFTNQKFYAIAKTWLDNSAPRAGCVLTHTLLIPIETWMTFPNPINLKYIFRKPENSNDTELYRKGLEVDSHSSASAFTNLNLDKDITTEFVYRYFSEGITPIVWLTEENAEDYFWKLTQSLWPHLRSQFACCTLSLQPRFLDDKPFDLMFAPFSTYTRFHQIPRENIIDRTNLIFYSPPRGINEEPWISWWTDHLLGISTQADDIQSDINKEMTELGPYLSGDPTVIKKIYLARELRKRSKRSPMAAIGLLDMVESIAQDESAAIIYKEESILIALQSIREANDKNEKLRCLLLISDRLKREAYSKTDPRITSQYYTTVAEYFSAEPNAALKEVEQMVETSNELPKTPYVLGIVTSLLKVGNDFPVRLEILRQYQESSPLLIGLEPRLGLLYLKADKFDKNIESPALKDLVTWISKISDLETLSHIRKVILPEVRNDQQKHLAEVLLRQLSEKDIHWILDTLSTSTNEFKPNGIRKIIINRVSKVFPTRVREWALQTDRWSSEVAELVAVTYPMNLSGVKEIIQTSQYNHVKKAQILAAFILNITQNNRLPQWFQEFASTNLDLLPALLINMEIIPDEVSEVIQTVINEVWELPIARSFQVQDIDAIVTSDRYQFGVGLVPSSMRSAITYYITGDIEWEAYRLWESTIWGNKWTGNIGARDLQLIFNRKCSESPDAWLRGWKWLANASENFYQYNTSLPQRLIPSLLSIHKGSWLVEVTDLWASIIKRISSQSKKSIYIQACADALNFSFRNYHYPISAIVIESFLPVYTVVVESENITFEAYNLFGYFDWDKGKELRKKIIDSFINSNWPPGDLVLSVRDEMLLRKIYSRLKRHRNGSEYIQAIAHDLTIRRNDPKILDLLDDFLSLTRQRDFYEKWD